MDSFVFLQITLISKGFTTLSAHVWLLTSVCADVPGKVAATGESLLAHTAAKWHVRSRRKRTLVLRQRGGILKYTGADPTPISLRVRAALVGEEGKLRGEQAAARRAAVPRDV